MTEKRPNLLNHNQWVLYARANNYPECDLCHEQLSRGNWKKGSWRYMPPTGCTYRQLRGLRAGQQAHARVTNGIWRSLIHIREVAFLATRVHLQNGSGLIPGHCFLLCYHPPLGSLVVDANPDNRP